MRALKAMAELCDTTTPKKENKLTEIILWVLALVTVIWVVQVFYLQGEDLSAFDPPTGQRRSIGSTPSEEHKAVVASIGGIYEILKGTPRREHIAFLRNYIDNAFPCSETAIQFTAVNVAGIPAEWVLAPHVDSGRRLLYIHGGAYIMGSPKSHRRLTAKFSEMANAAVLAIDYRLMPEHSRMEGIEDCRVAYRWMLVFNCVS
jgi:monoterpene epsilon-lactone hydrolase